MGGETTYTPVDIKTVTKDLVAVGENIPEPEPDPEPEPEPEPDPIIVLEKGITPNMNLYPDITGGWIRMLSYGSNTADLATKYIDYNGNRYPGIVAPWSGTQSKAVSNNKINVTDYNTITASGYVKTDLSSGFNSLMFLGLKSTIPAYVITTTDFDYQTNSQTGSLGTTYSPFILTLDISAVSGEYYVIVGVTHGTGTSAYTVFMIVDNITLSP